MSAHHRIKRTIAIGVLLTAAVASWVFKPAASRADDPAGFGSNQRVARGQAEAGASRCAVAGGGPCGSDVYAGDMHGGRGAALP